MTDDIAVVVAYFSPCGYSLPEQHLLRTLNELALTRTASLFIQVCKHDQKPISLRAGVGCITESVFYSDQAVFWKENLWNMAAKMLPHKKLAFIDSDIVFSKPGWLHEASRLLDEYDVIQPFEDCIYLDRCGKPEVLRKSGAYAVHGGIEPRPGEYHPGFAWCMTRDCFDRIGGFYDRNPVGGGDTSFVYCLDEKWKDTDLPQKLPHDMMTFWDTPSYKSYQANCFAQKLKVGYIEKLAVSHLWHGEIADRQYINRCTYLPPVEESEEYPLHYRYDGLIEWDKVEYSDRMLDYFKSRKEDGDE